MTQSRSVPSLPSPKTTRSTGSQPHHGVTMTDPSTTSPAFTRPPFNLLPCCTKGKGDEGCERSRYPTSAPAGRLTADRCRENQARSLSAASTFEVAQFLPLAVTHATHKDLPWPSAAPRDLGLPREQEPASPRERSAGAAQAARRTFQGDFQGGLLAPNRPPCHRQSTGTQPMTPPSRRDKEDDEELHGRRTGSSRKLPPRASPFGKAPTVVTKAPPHRFPKGFPVSTPKVDLRGRPTKGFPSRHNPMATPIPHHLRQGRRRRTA